MDSTTGLELAVVGAACITLGFSIWSLYISHKDRRAVVRLRQDGVKHLTINARLVRDVSRVCCSSVLLFAAAWCVYLPPDRDLAAMVMKIALLAISLMLGAAVLMDFRWRLRIDAALDELDVYRNTRSPEWK
jgi:hypothetical protein